MKQDNKTSNIFRTRYPQAFEGSIAEAQYFFFEAEPDNNNDLAIVFGGYERCAADFEIERSSYPYYVIECATKGECFLTINQTTHRLKRGTLAGFSPDIPHHYICDKDNPMEHIFIAFNGTRAPELLRASAIDTKGAIELAAPEEAIGLVEAILRNGSRKTEFSQELCCGYLRLLLLEQASASVLSGHDCALSEATYRRCRKFMDENFSNIFFPSEVAQACKIDVRYMSYLFNRYARVTPHQHLMRLKMNKAAIFLLTSNLPISRIASTVGFEDPYHFSRNFKKVYNISPDKYRNQYAQ
jgi:AraC-like DNA-binding protein